MRGIASLLNRTPQTRIIAVFILPVLALLAASCATTGFSEAKNTGLELRFYAWDSISISKPDTREDGFMPVYQLSELPAQLSRLNMPRELAVVVVVNNYDEKQAAGIGAKFRDHLSAQGFKRVVALRGSDQKPIAGLPIAFDSANSSGHGQPGFTDARTPSASGTDAANTSVASVR
jgi:hypothetical protein